MSKIRIAVIYLCVFFVCHSTTEIKAQVEKDQEFKLDSLSKELSRAKSDTAKIRLRYAIGFYSKNKRQGYWDSLLKDARKSNFPLYEAKTLDKIGMIYYQNTRRKEAERYFMQALAIFEAKGYKRETIDQLHNLALMYYDQVDKKKALDLYYKALKIAEELNDKLTIIDLKSDIARHYFSSGDIKKAQKIHFECLKMSRELDYHPGIASALVDLGSDYNSLKDSANSIKYYLESGKYAEEFGESVAAAHLNNSVAAAYGQLNQFDSSYKYAYRSYKICEAMNFKRGMASCMIVLAGIASEQGKHKEALKIALRNYELVKSISFTTQLPDLAYQLMLFYERDKDYKKALEFHRLHIQMRDSLSNEESRKGALEKEFEYNFQKKENENKILAQQNQIQLLEINEHKYLLLGLGGLLMIGLVILFLFSKQNKLKSQQQSMQLEQKLLRSQMNPHFIFNSLNSIQQFIMSGKNELAELYLSKFSKLIRDLLESNIKETITVEEEAMILQGYIEMESLRFSHSFSFSVKVDEKIDGDHLNIPHMMIQPFVENAIWHGLLTKEGERNLIVLFEYDSPVTVKCTVDDNGIGREKSSQRETTFKKKSLALSFIRQRLDLMRKALKVDCSLEIIDKKDEQGKTTGTKVIIVLPVTK